MAANIPRVRFSACSLVCLHARFLSKENSETRIVVRWVLLKIIIDGWQVFTTIIQPSQGWNINENGTAWKIVSVLSFGWVADLVSAAQIEGRLHRGHKSGTYWSGLARRRWVVPGFVEGQPHLAFRLQQGLRI